jgi:hypothetical protein
LAIRIRYDAPPTLGRFLDSNAFVRCVMGPVGSGKSSASVLELLRRAKEQAPGPDGIRRTRFAVIRNTYGQLRDTTRKTFEAWIPPQLGTWNEQQFAFRMRFGDVESEVLFRALDRPEDVGKLLSLDLTGAYVNEAREISKHVFEVLQSRLGRYPSKLQGGPTWFGLWMDTNPWHTGHWAAKLFRQRPDGHELYRQPGGRASDAENTENLPPGYYERMCAGKPSDWIRVYVDGLEASSDLGSVFGDCIDALEQRGGLVDFEHPPDGVFTSWDLGFTDSTAVWFWRLSDGGVDFVDHYEAHGKPLSHYFEVLERKAEQLGYRYARHWLPHDAAARTLASELSIQDQFHAKLGAGNVSIGPPLSLLDGIQAGRWLLEQPHTRFHAKKCEAGVEALREYRYEWDEAERVFSRRPLHNFASHTADAFRYAAVVVKVTELLVRKPKPKPAGPLARPLSHAFTLDELWESHGVGKKGGRI